MSNGTVAVGRDTAVWVIVVGDWMDSERYAIGASLHGVPGFVDDAIANVRVDPGVTVRG